MIVQSTKIKDVKLLTPKTFIDNRGSFMEAWNSTTFNDIGIPDSFIQDNVSTSIKGVLRGVHTQLMFPQSKIVYCLSGRIYDVAVDCRVNSLSYGQWYGEILSAENRKMMYIPEGVAHGYYTIEDATIFMKVSTHYTHGDEIGFKWNDSKIGINWPIDSVDEPILAEKDLKWGSYDDMMDILTQYR